MKSINFFNVLLILSAIMFLPFTTKAQVTIGGTSDPQSFSILELISNDTRGFRLPQLSEYQRDNHLTPMLEASLPDPATGVSPAMGLQIFNTCNRCVETWNGREWISLCEGDDPDPCARANGVMIAGVCWARSNVDLSTSSGFAASPGDAGMFFRWGNNRGWRSYGAAAYWRPLPYGDWYAVANVWTQAASAPLSGTGAVWNGNVGPCPEGWRLPTEAELTALRNHATNHGANPVAPWRTAANSGFGVAGWLVYGVGGDTLFLPAARSRVLTGELDDERAPGNYWSSTSRFLSDAWELWFSSSSSGVSAGSRAFGYSVRCVRYY